MTSSYWQKRNRAIWYIGLSIITLIILVVSVLATWMGVAKNGVTLLITLIAVAIVFTLTRALMNHYPQSLIRTVNLEYQSALFALRKLFKEKQIVFDKTDEKESTCFEFPGQSVTMSLQKGMSGYVIQEVGIQPYAVLTIHKVNEKNEPFIELLTASIDEMAN